MIMSSHRNSNREGKSQFSIILSWPPSIAHTLSYWIMRYIVQGGFCPWFRGGCTARIDAMTFITGNKPIQELIEEKAVVLHEKLLRIPGDQYWKTYVNKPRNLRTQNGFIQKVTEIKTKFEIPIKVNLKILCFDRTQPQRAHLFPFYCNSALKNVCSTKIIFKHKEVWKLNKQITDSFISFQYVFQMPNFVGWWWSNIDTLVLVPLRSSKRHS